MTGISRGPAKRGLIIGCGVAGPALAMALQRAGIEAVVYEGRPSARDAAGSFLGLAPNARDVLQTLGVREEIEALGLPSPRIAFLNHKGKQLGINPQPVITFKRGRLTQGLREAASARGIQVEWNKRLVGVDQAGGSVVAHFADGSSATGDFLVGCDGTYSEVRRAILPQAPAPRYTEIVGSGAYTKVPGLGSTNGTMYMTFCLNGFFGYQVADDGEVYWFENYHQRREPAPGELDGVPRAEWKQRLLKLHEPDHEPISTIIGQTEMDIVRWTVVEMPPLDTWYRGRVGLVGDAAHAMGPHTGQGGSMALEDAIVLAQCLRDIPEVEGAFATYQRIRKERVEYVVEETRRTGERKAPPGLFGRMTRDLVLPIFLKKGVAAAAGIHDHHIEWSDRVAAASR
jgi:2-polyprenyl-6-methoxyphenol hydroxylase-like FAD-dependent oxidoreductase